MAAEGRLQRGWKLAALVVFVFLASWGVGTLLSQNPGGSGPDLPESWVLIWGEIVDAETGRPVAGTVRIDGHIVTQNASRFAEIVALPRDRLCLEVYAAGYLGWTRLIPISNQMSGQPIGGKILLVRASR